VCSLSFAALSLLLLPCFVKEVNAAITPITFTITSVKCIDPCRNEGLEAAGQSAPDFYALININGVVTQTPRGDEDSQEITPFWTISADIPNTQPTFSVSIQIWDHDSTSGDDLGDASPVPGKNNLDLIVDRVTGRWTGDLTWPQRCAHGGNPGGEPAVEICFDIGGYEDTDGDGLLDHWEKNGLDADSDGKIDVDLPKFGANPFHKDIFLELDWMPEVAGRSLPTRQGIQAIKAAFAAAPSYAGGTPNPDGKPGINLWIDTGDLIDPSLSEDGGGPNTCGDGLDNGLDGVSDRSDPPDPDCLVGDNLGGGNVVDVSNISGLTRSFYDVKTVNFDLRRRLVFHYGLSSAHPTNNTGTSTGGNGATYLNDISQNWIPGEWNEKRTWIPGEWKGRTVIITGGTGSNPLQSRTITDNTATSFTIDSSWTVIPDETSRYRISLVGGDGEMPGNDFVEFNHDPGTIMHELGHNIGLSHGGNDSINCKPNYVSVMNYDHQFGIIQNVGSGQGQDFNSDGILEILDYSPPRFPNGRGRAPLPTLIEGLLDESIILDPRDTANQFIFTNPLGKFDNPLNQRADWSGDGDTNDYCIPNQDNCPIFNVNTVGLDGIPPDCANDFTNQSLNGYNDWLNIRLNVLNTADPQNAPINRVNEQEPTLEDRDRLLRELNTTDLEIKHSDFSGMAVAGQEIVYTLTIQNNGPRLARKVRVENVLPQYVTHTSNTDNCAPDSSGKLICDLGELPVGKNKEITIRAHLAADLPCKKDEQFILLTNNATVQNLSGPDLNPKNNDASQKVQILCVKYEYAASLICGKQNEPTNMNLARGFYATSTNIHNPNDKKVYLFKKLALTYPPSEQKPGSVVPLAIVSLQYDEALKIDCTDIQRRLFKEELPKDEFPAPYISGYVIIQSPFPLDVTAIHSMSNADFFSRLFNRNNIHIEQIRERRRLQLHD